MPGGIGEEDIVCLVLPYIRSAREGVVRLGELLRTYGTYEMNGSRFGVNEIWWLESHRRPPLMGPPRAGTTAMS